MPSPVILTFLLKYYTENVKKQQCRFQVFLYAVFMTLFFLYKLGQSSFDWQIRRNKLLIAHSNYVTSYDPLALCTLDKIFSRRHYDFFFFPRKQDLTIHANNVSLYWSENAGRTLNFAGKYCAPVWFRCLWWLSESEHLIFMGSGGGEIFAKKYKTLCCLKKTLPGPGQMLLFAS